MADFVHLHLHTLYSLLDGAIRIKDLLKTVQEKGMKSVAVTDHGNLFGAVDFYKKAREAGVKPILGMEAYVAGDKGRADRTERHRPPPHPAGQERRGLGQPAPTSPPRPSPRASTTTRASTRRCCASTRKGLIGLTACLGGEVPRLLPPAATWTAPARPPASTGTSSSPGSFFLEVQSNGMEEQLEVNAEAGRSSPSDEGIPLVATADAHYVDRKDARAHEVLMCIASGKTLTDEKRISTTPTASSSPAPTRWWRPCPQFREAIDNTLRIAELCNVELHARQDLPAPLPGPRGRHRGRRTSTQLARRRPRPALRARSPAATRTTATPTGPRLELELGVIQKMGFPGYFLIVQDFINWAKEHGIPVGPGRGSGAGSHRRLGAAHHRPRPASAGTCSSSASSTPSASRCPTSTSTSARTGATRSSTTSRDKYGKDNVGQIITFGSLKARSVIRDVVRVMGLPFAEGDRIAKLVPDPVQGKTPPLKELVFGVPAEGSVAAEPRLAEMYREAAGRSRSGPTPRARRRRSPPRTCSTSPWRSRGSTARPACTPPAWSSPTSRSGSTSRSTRTTSRTCSSRQFAKDEVGDGRPGEVRLPRPQDPHRHRRRAPARHGRTTRSRTDLQAADIPLDDPAVYELISRGDTAGVFQMESSGFTEMVMKMKPSRLRGHHRRRRPLPPRPARPEARGRPDHGRRLHRPQARPRAGHATPTRSCEPILKDTYGVIVYQEQVMQISQALGGYSLGQADLLRRAMGKKKAEEMAKERVRLHGGRARPAASTPKVAGGVFDLMEKFAAYGFNKSPLGRLRPAHRPDRLAQGPLPGRVHGGAHLQRGLQHRQGGAPHRRGARRRHRGAAARRQRVDRASSAPCRRQTGERLRGASASAWAPSRASARRRSRPSWRPAPRAARSRASSTSPRASTRGASTRRWSRRWSRAAPSTSRGCPRWQLFAAIDAGLRGRGLGPGRPPERPGQPLRRACRRPQATPRYPRPGDPLGEGAVEEWPERVRLAFEKEALGFYITGHPLAGHEKEVRRYASSTCAARGRQAREGQGDGGGRGRRRCASG